MSAALRVDHTMDITTQRVLEAVLDAAKGRFTGRITIDFLHGKPKAVERIERVDPSEHPIRPLTTTG